MGYRLYIQKYNKEGTCLFYGTKLYGYIDHDDFLSFIYLVSIGKLEKDSTFYDCDYNTLFLNKKELTIFLNLYLQDLKKSDYYKAGESEKQFEKIIKEETLSDIYDDNMEDNYIISWC